MAAVSDPNDLERIVDAIVRRVLAENPSDAGEALRRAYPFGDHPEAAEMWAEAVKRHQAQPPSSKRRRTPPPTREKPA